MPPGETTAKPWLLLVDDTRSMHALVARYAGEDFDPIEYATDGRQALQLLRERLAARQPLPSVIVSDLDMAPGMCGDEFAREVAKDPCLAAIPFLLSSGDPAVTMIARSLGVQGFEKYGTFARIRDVLRRLAGIDAPAADLVATQERA